MNFDILINNKYISKNNLDIIKKNKMQVEFIITYKTKEKNKINELTEFLKEKKFIYITISTKERKLEFSTDKSHGKSKIYVIKEVIPSQPFIEIDEMYLYLTFIKSYKRSITI